MNVRGARVHRYPLWTFGELAYITFDRDDAARACAALRFHAIRWINFDSQSGSGLAPDCYSTY